MDRRSWPWKKKSSDKAAAEKAAAAADAAAASLASARPQGEVCLLIALLFLSDSSTSLFLGAIFIFTIMSFLCVLVAL